jgi:Flp pilus assembly pilin Flp
MFVRFIRDDQGQDLIEYLLLGSFIAIVALVGATYLGTQLNNWYDKMGQWVSSAAQSIPSGAVQARGIGASVGPRSVGQDTLAPLSSRPQPAVHVLISRFDARPEIEGKVLL